MMDALSPPSRAPAIPTSRAAALAALYDCRNGATMIFDADPHVANDPRRWERELFARVPYIQPGSPAPNSDHGLDRRCIWRNQFMTPVT